MKNIFSIIMTTCLLLTGFSVLTVVQAAEISEERMYELYGEELLEVPFAIRYAYHKKYGGNWYNAPYKDRYDFLDQWHIETEEREAALEKRLEEEQEYEEARLEALEEKKEREEDAQKALQKRIKAREKAEKARRKAWQRKIKERDRKLDELRRKQGR